jgi:hypothetical protein
MKAAPTRGAKAWRWKSHAKPYSIVTREPGKTRNPAWMFTFSS